MSQPSVMRTAAAAVIAIALLVILSSGMIVAPATTAAAAASQDEDRATVIINITRGPENLMNLMTAYRMADGALDAGKRVVLYFNKSGAHVPVRRFPTDLRIGDERTVWEILQGLHRRGAELIVCGETTESLGIIDAEFIPEAKIANSTASIFSRVNNNTVVFTY